MHIIIVEIVEVFGFYSRAKAVEKKNVPYNTESVMYLYFVYRLGYWWSIFILILYYILKENLY